MAARQNHSDRGRNGIAVTWRVRPVGLTRRFKWNGDPEVSLALGHYRRLKCANGSANAVVFISGLDMGTK